MPTFANSFQHSTTVLERAILTRKKKKASKLERKLYLFGDNMILYIENLNYYTHTHTHTHTQNKLLEQINSAK